MLKIAVSFFAACIFSMAIGPSVINWLKSVNARQTVRDDIPKQHQAKQGTPTMGGLIIFLGAVLGIAVGLFLTHQSDPKVWPVITLVVGCGLLGFLDDFLSARRGKNLGLKARHKLAGQFIIAIGFVIWICHVRTHDFTAIMLWDRAIDLGWAYYPLAVLLVVGMSNAVNLADGLDGLVGGLMTMSMLTIALLTAHWMRPGLAVIAFAIAGGCVGFLKHNYHPAKVFMGDTGSLALGAAVAGLGIASRMEVLILLIGAVYIVEALSVTIQVISFKTTGKRVFKMSPIHHHFELCGWPEQTIVRRFWAVQLLITVVVLLWKCR